MSVGVFVGVGVVVGVSVGVSVGVEVGAAVIVDDLPDEKERCEWLWEELEKLMKDEKARQVMAEGCKIVANAHAAQTIANSLLSMAGGK